MREREREIIVFHLIAYVFPFFEIHLIAYVGNTSYDDIKEHVAPKMKVCTSLLIQLISNMCNARKSSIKYDLIEETMIFTLLFVCK